MLAAPERTITWVGPFAVFVLWLAVDKYVPIANPAKELLRDAVLVAAIFYFSRSVLPTRAPHWVASIAVGVAVCAIWVAPDALVPGWRENLLFQNAITGHIKRSIAPHELTPLMLVLRTNAPGGTRTPNLLIRSQMLYPIELRALIQLCACSERPGSSY